jgi:hypothetical protein
MKLYLYCLNTFEYIPLTDGLTFGRNKGQINFSEDPRMSGLHAKITIKEDNGVPQAYIEDLNSKNRTMVDHVEIDPYQLQRLVKHTVVQMGDIKMFLTDKTNYDILEINEIAERVESKPVVKLEGRKLIQEIHGKVAKKVDELKTEQSMITLAINETNKKIQFENDKIKQIDTLKVEFLKKQEEERKAYFETLDSRIGAFKQEISKYVTEKNKLEEKYSELDNQIQEKASRLKN